MISFGYFNNKNLPPLKLRIHAHFFKKDRQEYYDYLSMIMVASMGMKTMKDIFRDDAIRYGPNSNRGALSAYWENKISENGDVAETFRGTLPEEDVNFISLLQSAGGGIMEKGLSDLSHLIQVEKKLGLILKRFFVMAFFSVGLLIIMLFALGYFLAPEVKNSFSTIDPSYYKPLTKRFFWLADSVREKGFVYLGGFAIFLSVMPYIMRNLTGGLRSHLDKYGVFRLYRDVKSIRFVLNLATLIKDRSGSESISLPRAIHMLSQGENRWMRWHLNRMLEKINTGDIGVETFDTGLFEQDVIWYLEDMTAVVGLDEALQRSKERLETHTISNLDKKSKILIWVMLLTSVATMISSYLWVMAVINEMTSLMKLGLF